MPLDKDLLLDLVAKGKTREAINHALTLKEQISDKNYLAVVALSAELEEIKRGSQDRTLSDEVINIRRNGINKSFIHLVSKLDEVEEPSPIKLQQTTNVNQAFAPPDQTTASPKALAGFADTQSKIEKWVDTIAYVIEQLIKRPWKYKLINLVAVLLVFLNPIVFKKVWELVIGNREILNTIHYSRYFWILTGLLFIVAIILAVQDILKGGRTTIKASFSSQSPIKGLRHFDFEDAAIFKKLQRHQDIETCLQGITGKDYRFGVLTGESGCGKTSFLRAGLSPAFAAKTTGCVVVKLRNEAPLQSIHHALVEQLGAEVELEQGTSLKELLLSSMQNRNVTGLVLIIDQFEQFFTQYKLAETREPFIQQLNECYQSFSNVKILVSLRKDYQGYLYEIQDVLGYALVTRDNYFDLKKFTPTQATEIFKVMAEAEALEFDTSFVYDTCKEELASKDDGLISAVDIQILAFIIKGQQLEEKAFTRSAFQKMGGIEGLLQRYLQEHLDTPNRYNQDQAALKVLLAFIDLDHNLRSGDLTAEQLLERVNKPLNLSELLAILNWLEVLRLITKTENQNQKAVYELAHEWLILPLRNLAGKSLTKMDQANLVLERRTNEWLVNERKARFLLSWGEYRNVVRHQKLLSWGRTEEAKKDLLKATRKKFQWRFGLLAMIVLFALIGWGYNRQMDAIDQLFTEADQDVLALEYDSAAIKLYHAGQMRLRSKRAAQKLLEVVFYYNEIGDTLRAVKLFQDTVLTLVKKGEVTTLLASEESATQDRIRNALILADSSYYQDSLMIRYFSKMIKVKRGAYQIGYLKNDRPPDSARVVTLSDFRMAETETTVWQYELFAQATTGKRQNKPNQWDWIGSTPVVNVSWYDALAYANWVSERLGYEKVYGFDNASAEAGLLTPDTVWWENKGFRLPTEAEWEYAARGGMHPDGINQDTFIYSGSNDLDLVGWYDGNSAEKHQTQRTNKVRSKAANRLGLYDMSGNVWEWCWDKSVEAVFFESSRNIGWGRFDNPVGPKDGRYPILRGGSWLDDGVDCEVTLRNYLHPHLRYYDYGFRLSQGF